MYAFDRIRSLVEAVERETDHLWALLCAQYPSSFVEHGDGDYRLYFAELPTGQAARPVHRTSWGLFPHVEWDVGLTAWDSRSEDEWGPRVRRLTAQIAEGRPRVPCDVVYADLACVRDRHLSGNHEDPSGRDWWIQPVPKTEEDMK